jgi:putative RecB family exonuclease
MEKEAKISKIFSHSRLSTFEKCALKYKFRYLDQIIPEVEKTIESHLGNVSHNTLEWLYKQVSEGRIPTVDDIIVFYSNDWKENYDPDILIVRKNITVEDYFNRGVEFLINYYIQHYPFDDNTLSVEEEIFFDLDENGEYKIRGFIDRLSFNIDKQEYEIHDYKTSGNLPKDGTLDEDRQLALYAIAVKEKYGNHKKVRLVWHYLFFNKIIESRRTNEQLEQLKKDTLDLIRKIESTKEFSPTKSPLCSWCEYKDICPAWGNKPPEKQEEIDRYF